VSERWQRRPDGSNWGDFGPDDQLGRLNLLTPERVLRAAAEVRTGDVFCLSVPLDHPGPAILVPYGRHPPVLRPSRSAAGSAMVNYQWAQDDPRTTDVINDDLVVLHLQGSTQWDSLAHVGQLFDADGDGVPEPLYYNGFKADVDIVGTADPELAGPEAPFGAGSTSRAHALGIEHMAERGMQARGVLVDAHAHVGREQVSLGWRELSEMLDRDGVVIEEGDVLCLHTGLAKQMLEMGDEPDLATLVSSCASLDGADPELLDWIDRTGIVAIVSDNFAVETFPARERPAPRSAMPLHEHCLFKLGVHLGELWYLTDLAAWLRANGRSRFLLTAPPLRLPGAFGSPVTPVATV
jgi:kynurenine formamidase